MKKIIKIAVVMIMVFSTMFALTGCGNKDMLDTVYTYDYAIVSMPDGTIEKIEIKQWCDYEGEQVQIKAKDGTIYLVSSVNCILIRE